ncbi:outer membrane beta-barrel protein [Methylobacterium sp. J-078]|uniref:outer membrane protein n=1 Tax=Methylobacterium sp. J-078 TaxID=2836657 RepID=UPI001FBBF831|nr:outer membrane beta-barrel protein [Methylobacterium sp. J-078]MCJ2046495.1 outer membrane beta-barrel protein [Methylobacterium sp. J-078]
MINRSIAAAAAMLTLFDLAAASAADLPVRSAPPVFTAPVPEWTGFYIGAQGGYRFDEVRGTGFLADPTASGIDTRSARLNLDSVVGGPRIGYDLQVGQSFVVGVVGDFSFGGGRGLASGTGIAGGVIPPGQNQAFGLAAQGFDGVIIAPGRTVAGSVSVHHAWDATVRARVGYLYANNVLLYATGGLALANERLSAAFTVNGVPGGAFSKSQTRTGWTAGAGIEYAITEHWRTHVEYRYADYGSSNYNWASIGATAKAKFSTNTVLAGVSYKF